MEYIITAVWIFLELLFVTMFQAAFFELRRNKKQIYIAFAIIYAVAVIYSLILKDGVIKQALSLMIVFAASLYLFKCNHLRRILLIIIGYILIVGIDTAVVYGASMLLNVSVSEFVWMKLFYSVVVTIGKLFLIFAGWLIIKRKAIRSVPRIRSSTLLLSAIFPLVSMVMLLVLFFGFKYDRDLSPGVTIFSILVVLANVATLYLIQKLEKNASQEIEISILNERMAAQNSNVEYLKSSYAAQRKTTHEYENHIQILDNLLELKQYDEAKRFLNTLRNDRSMLVFSVNSGHSVIDVILNQKYQKAREMGIEMQIQVNDLSRFPVDSNALAVLFSNLLNNAIEACERVEGKKEILCSLILEDDLYISIRNTSAPVLIVNDFIPTSKTPRHEHGYGLPAIKKVLEDLGAEYTFNYSEGWFQFAAEIPSK